MRKFTADYLFTGREMAPKGSILVTKDDGTVEAILPSANAEDGAAAPGAEMADDVEVLPGLLTPGFVNCHCHLELSHMKGILPERTGMVDFLLAVIRGRNASAGGAPLEKDQSIILEAIAEAEESMLHNGIVAVGDICNTSHTLQQKGEGRMYYHNFIETMGFIEQTAPDRYKAALELFQDFAGAYTIPIGANSLAPHAPYSVSSRLFQLIASFPGNQLMTIHNQESLAENLFCQTGQGDFLRLYQALGLDVSFFKGTGKRSLAGYLPHFYRNQTLLLVHNVDTREEDFEWLRQWKGGIRSDDLRWCLCPNANLYIEGQLPDVDLLMRYGCNIVLGTDSLASNHQLDILEEMKTLQQHFEHLSTATLLQWATYNGAE
ncbi:MAG TPA: amidohydrolase family protein, partial [Puia sp.]|nr:amidohydrolase family protein [Puia sp.]